MWDRLQEGLSDGRYIPVEVMAILYEKRIAFLEREIFQIVMSYSESAATACRRYDMSEFTVEQFKDVGRFPSKILGRKFSYLKCKSSENGSATSTCNFWKMSCVVDAAAHSEFVFTACLKLFFKIAVDTQFSVLFIQIVHDFFSLLSSRLNRDIFKVFPTHLQHIVFLLTLPLYTSPDDKIFENELQVQVTQEALLQVANHEGVLVAQSLLCFFPFWFSVLSQNKFLDGYLNFLPKDNTDVEKVLKV